MADTEKRTEKHVPSVEDAALNNLFDFFLRRQVSDGRDGLRSSFGDPRNGGNHIWPTVADGGERAFPAPTR